MADLSNILSQQAALSSKQLAGINDKLSARGDLVKAIKSMKFSLDGLTSMLVGKKVTLGGNTPQINAADTTEAENEATKRDEKIISLLEIIAGNTEIKPGKDGSTENEEPVKLGGIATGLAVSLGAIVGALSGWVKAIKFFGRALGLGGGAGKEAGLIGQMIQRLKNTMTNLLRPIRAVIGYLGNVSSVFQSIGKGLSTIGKWASSFGKVFGMVAKIASKIFYPLTVVLTLWDTLKGMFEGFSEGGIVGAIGGAIKGFFNSLIFGPLDMLKDALAWVLGIFGFDKAKEILQSFSFEDLFTNLIDTILSPFKWLQDKIVAVGKWISDKLGAAARFLGIGNDEEQARLERNRDNARQDANRARSMAVGQAADGTMLYANAMENGQIDQAAAEAMVKERGGRLFSAEERQKLQQEADAKLATAEQELADFNNAPTLAKMVNGMTESIGKWFTSIGESLGKMVDDLGAAFKTYLIDPIGTLISDYVIKPIMDTFDRIYTWFDEILHEYIIDPIASAFENITTWFTDLKETVTSFFEDFGIPEFVLYEGNRFIDPIKIGPWYPFRPEAGTEKVSSNTKMTATSDASGETRSYDDTITDVAHDRTDVMITSERSDNNGSQLTRGMASFDTRTGTATYSDESGEEKEISMRAFRQIKAAARQNAGGDALREIIAQDEAYQKLSWLERRRVDLTGEDPRDILTKIESERANDLTPLGVQTGEMVDTASSEADLARSSSGSQTPIVVAPSSSNTVNQSSTYSMAPPIRNTAINPRTGLPRANYGVQ